MVTTWRLEGIKSIDPSTMRVKLTEVVDGVTIRGFTKDFSKALTQTQVLDQFALFVKQKRQQEVDDRLPFSDLDLRDFETRVGNS